MTEKLTWNYVAQALNGPNISAAGSIKVDAYDKFEITISDTATQLVNLVPGGAVSLLAINPKIPDKDLTYELNGSDIKLDGPHVLIGSGAVSLLGLVK